MNDVRLDPEQVPACAELLLAAELGEDAPGRPLYARLDPDGDGEPAVRVKVGAVLTRRLYATEATETLSAAAYGNPLRGRPGHAPSVPVGSALLARTDTLDARGWRVYRVAPNGTVLYDGWIEHDPANAEAALAELRAATATSPAAALRRAVDSQPGHASEAITRWLAGQAERHGEAPLAGGTPAVAARPRPQRPPRMTSSTGTDPRAAGLVARERLERHGVSTLSDAELLTIANAPGRAHLQRTMSRTREPDTHGNRPTTR